MSKNNNLHNAKRTKYDEFYTQLIDIEKEMKFYKDFFKNKIIYCNCDNIEKSNFFKYFYENFEYLNLKKLILTEYKENEKGIISIYENKEIKTNELKGDGDFRSKECMEFLKEADVVVTNPPFSLFREFITQLIKYNKNFIIMSNLNTITYKEVFPYIKENKIWLGCSLNGTKCNFIVPDDYEGKNVFIENNIRYEKINNAIWLTNVEHTKRNQPIKLIKKYIHEEYPKFDNYDVIECGKVNNIPKDYNGVMAVPITFLTKYCPNQFEILGIANNVRYIGDFPCLTIINDKKIYNRILIKNKIFS